MQRALVDHERSRRTEAGSGSAEARGSLVLGRYRPLHPLGSGGSGSVWLARDEREGREVALKIVRREGNSGSRAEREAEAAARLRHPRCLRALALDRDDGHVYVAYEYVRGQTLREALRGGELSDAAAIEAGAQMLEALAHAHRKGVIHRDVKPSNVMLADADGDPAGDGDAGVSVRLLDFGLAHVDEADTLTASGDVPGTLAYIAPERLNGQKASGAADIWSVGLILWEALAGWHPFSAPSPVETARRIGSGAPPLARSRPDLPRELCALVDRMLDRDPGRRPTAKRLAAALRSAADSRARRERPTSAPRTLRERALHAVLAACFAAGAGLLLPFYPRGWPLALAVFAGLAALRAPRAGLTFALAVPVLPLGNAALGLALAYAAVTLAWLAVFARDARSGLLFVAGPLLAPAGALALVPALALRARGPLRRAALAGLAVLAAAAVAGLAGSRLPLTGETPPATLGIAASERPGAAVAAVVHVLGAHPLVPLASLLFAVFAAAAPLALRRGYWAVASWGSCFLAAALVVPALAGAGPIEALKVGLGAAGAAAWLAFLALRERE